MRFTFYSVSIRPRLEISFEDWFQNKLECPLDHAIADRGNREDAALSAPILRHLLFPCAHGPIRVSDQFVSDLLKKTFISALFARFERDPVYSRCLVVLFAHTRGLL